MKINKTDIIETLKDGGKFLGALAVRIYGDSLNQAGEQAFSEAIELGIENTVASLYGAKVSDKEIIRVVCEHWGISCQETEDRLLWEKQQATIRSLRQYLKLQGYSSLDIKNYMMETKALMRIRHEKDLWNLKDAPENLFKVLHNNN
mgnify:CR=1 FL=1